MKELTAEISTLKKMVESIVKEPTASVTEESVGGNADASVVIRKQFREFLKMMRKKLGVPKTITKQKNPKN